MQEEKDKPKTPKKFEAIMKTPPDADALRGLFVIEVNLPDGLHWFGGLTATPPKDGKQLAGVLWSPYLEDTLYFPDEYSATRTMEIMQLNKTAGAYVKCAYDVEFWKAKFNPNDN